MSTPLKKPRFVVDDLPEKTISRLLVFEKRFPVTLVAGG